MNKINRLLTFGDTGLPVAIGFACLLCYLLNSPCRNSVEELSRPLVWACSALIQDLISTQSCCSSVGIRHACRGMTRAIFKNSTTSVLSYYGSPLASLRTIIDAPQVNNLPPRCLHGSVAVIRAAVAGRKHQASDSICRVRVNSGTHDFWSTKNLWSCS